jgi:hypothetical protein
LHHRPAQKQNTYPSTKHGGVKIPGPGSKVASGRIDNPGPIEPEVNNQENEEKQRQIEMEISPLMTMQAQQILLPELGPSGWDNKFEQEPNDGYCTDIDKKQSICDVFERIFCHRPFLFSAKTTFFSSAPRDRNFLFAKESIENSQS